ncbi:hypothetical protein C5167_003587 [Papaver somniferum]|uniref:Uncharacterized protein n=1 Tax=Papaver somniferum TaxID=3469 RepID=A0A4Y7L2F8_PAPSO|nr:hypothetical protein C5167_003587 [Papaver somniferum]
MWIRCLRSTISQVKNSKEDLVITLLDSYGFTKPLISKIITKYPPILSSDPHKTLKPNIDFFISKGLSGLELAKFISSNPNLLKRNLQNHIIPPFNTLKNILQSDKNVITTLKRQSSVFFNNNLGI